MRKKRLNIVECPKLEDNEMIDGNLEYRLLIDLLDKKAERRGGNDGKSNSSLYK